MISLEKTIKINNREEILNNKYYERIFKKKKKQIKIKTFYFLNIQDDFSVQALKRDIFLNNKKINSFFEKIISDLVFYKRFILKNKYFKIF